MTISYCEHTLHRPACLGRLLEAGRSALFLVLLLIPHAQALTPSPEGRQIRAEILEAHRIAAASYVHTGPARRLRQIKLERHEAEAAGRAFTPGVVSFRLPVLVGSFSDNAHIFSASQFDSMLFGANSTGNMTDYYNEVSYGQLSVTGDVLGPFTASGTQAFYVNGDGGAGNDFPNNVGGFVISLLQGADPATDFSQYDNDGPDGIPNSGDDDGEVDGLVVIHPDGSQSFGDTDNFYSHTNYLQFTAGSKFETNDPRSGGGFIEVNYYMVGNAERGDGTLDVMRSVGVYCHEFGHILGLPDLYDIDNSSWGIGSWCLMSFGSLGGAVSQATEHRPVHMSAWCKLELGWLTPTVVFGTEHVTIPAVETTPTVYKLWDDAYQHSRFFLLENRTQTGFDADIPGEGVLIWHCNEDVCWDNFSDGFRLVDLEEADGLDEIDSKSSTGDDRDLYPGTSGNTSFNDLSSPSSGDPFGSPTGASAEGFAYVSGPGSDVSVVLTQRKIAGFTLAHFGHMWLGTTTGPAVSYGASRFVSPARGSLVGVKVGTRANNATGYTVRLFNDIVGSTPVGLQSSSAGTLPLVGVNQFVEVPLSTTSPIASGETLVVDVAWGPATFAWPYVSSRLASPSAQSYWSQDGVTYNPWTSRDPALKALVQCPVALAGDVNTSGSITSADIIYLVGYVFKGGAGPEPCAAAADTDCNRSVTSADIIYLVNFVFKGGPEPCDICALIPDAWACP